MFTKFSASNMKGNAGNSYIVLRTHQKAGQLTLSLTANDKRRKGFGSSQVVDSNMSHLFLLCICGG